MRGVVYLHPELQDIVEVFLADCIKSGLRVAITETFRSKTEQDNLYAKGRTSPGSIVTNCKYPDSPHCWGVAFDFCRNDGKAAYDDSDGFFSKVGTIGKKHGLFWGGDFHSFTDKPHLEMIKYLPNNSVKTLMAQYKSPDNFKKTWKAEDEEMPNVTYIKIALPNGKEMTLPGYVVDGSSFTQLRPVVEALGFKVGYADGKITIQ